jgi:hypothetical protein
MSVFLRLASIATIVLTSTQLHAGVIPFAINQSWTQGGASSDIFGFATTIDLPGTDDFVVDPGASERYFDFSFKENGGGGTFSTVNTQLEGYFFLDTYSNGETVGLGNFGDHNSPSTFNALDWDTILVNNQTAGVWGASHAGALGFRTDAGQYGYINYGFTRSGLLSTLNMLDGYYESNVGQGIVVGGVSGVVPEPSSIAIWSLTAMSMGFLWRRKRNLL